MDNQTIRTLLDGVSTGSIDVTTALAQLSSLPFATESLSYATLDTGRKTRTGFAEVVYGAGKTPAQCIGIAETLLGHQPAVLFTRLSDTSSAALIEAFPVHRSWTDGRTLLIGETPEPVFQGKVLVVTAGTSDLPVADECVATLLAHGADVGVITDVGVAGIHRILAKTDELRTASVVIVVAGMDGALPSVVGGLVGSPVIAVPTSVGYGAAFAGVAPLLTMLNACASGITVVNIDNGFGGAMAALRILRGPETIGE